MTKLYCMKADGFDSQSGGFTDVIINDKYYSKDTIVKALQDYEQLEAKIAELEEQNLRLLRGEFGQICSYCGWETPASGSSWGELQVHIRMCPKHPVSKLQSQLDAIYKQQKPVGTVHDDGYFVWKGTPPHEYSYAGFRMEVYLHPSADALDAEKYHTALNKIMQRANEGSNKTSYQQLVFDMYAIAKEAIDAAIAKEKENE